MNTLMCILFVCAVVYVSKQLVPLFGRIACVFGFHGWQIHNLTRECADCGKRQVWVRVGKKSGWR